MRIVSLSLVSLLLMSADLPDPAKLPANSDLPDPLVTFGGERITSAEGWEGTRKPELKRLFQHYMYGELPPPRAVKAKVVHEDKKAFDGKATLREVRLSLGTKAPPIHVLLVVPNERTGPVPVFVGMNFEGNHALVDDPKVRLPDAWMYANRAGVKDNKATEAGRGKAKEAWAIDQTIARGYAVATLYSGDVDPDVKDKRGGLRPFFDPDEKAGTIAFWAWGIHRVVDHLVTLPELDAKKIAVVGHSRLGKTALVAAAFDERIALAIPNQAGCGGTAPSRGKVGESVARINSNFPHWFNANFKKFSGRPEHLPFDQHCLAALVAPRPLLFTNAVEDTWANPDGQFEVLKAAEPVYKLLKAGGLESRERPPVGTLSGGTLGYYIRAGKHSMTRDDWKVYLDFADRHFGQSKGRSSAKKKLLLLGQGPDGHAPTTHEYMAGLKILAGCLAKRTGVDVTTVKVAGKWPEGPDLIDRADGVVLFLAEGAKWVGQDKERLAAFRRLAARGGGRVSLHWAMGAREEGPIKDYLALFGGCHGGPDRKYKIVTGELSVGDHPIGTGVGSFTIKDEFYYALKFSKKAPDAVVKVTIDGMPYVVGWASEEKGKAFGFAGLHYHDNWKRPEYRRLVTQGVLWSVGLPIPRGGVDVSIDSKLLELKSVP